MEQKQAAMQALAEWLADDHELGQKPSRIESAGEFDLHGLHYYIFRYKRSVFSSKWMLGVAGGYEEGSLEHCGHVYSEMETYNSETAEQKAKEMVERIRAYWMREAQAQESGEKSGPFIAFVLLKEADWDCQKLRSALQQDWDLTVKESDQTEDSLIIEQDGIMTAVNLIKAPVPDEEAEKNAANNYLWPEAVQTVRAHQAHLLIAALGSAPALAMGQLFTKICASACAQDQVLGVYTSGTVFRPEFYREAAMMMKYGDLPVLNWIYFGLYGSETGMCAYTYGLEAFGKDEMEILDSAGGPEELRDFLLDIVCYVLDQNVVLNDGETLGFTADQKLPITRRPGRSLDKMMLQIGYRPKNPA